MRNWVGLRDVVLFFAGSGIAASITRSFNTNRPTHSPTVANTRSSAVGATSIYGTTDTNRLATQNPRMYRLPSRTFDEV